MNLCLLLSAVRKMELELEDAFLFTGKSERNKEANKKSDLTCGLT